MYLDEDPNVINMPLNVHDNSRNDALATIDPDVHIRRFTNCIARSRGHSTVYFVTKIIYLAQF